MATQDEIAAHIDVGVRHVRRLLAAGVLPRSKGRGGLDLDRCRLAYLSHLRGVAAGHQSKDGSLDLTEERAKLAREQTETAALKNAESRGELVPADEVRSYWANQIIASKSRIRALPHEIKGAIPHLTSEEIEEVRRLVVQCQTDLADGIPPTAEKNGSIGECNGS